MSDKLRYNPIAADAINNLWQYQLAQAIALAAEYPSNVLAIAWREAIVKEGFYLNKGHLT